MKKKILFTALMIAMLGALFILMPSSVKAAEVFGLDITNGTAKVNGEEVTEAEAGVTVTITAEDAEEGEVFSKWEVTEGTATLASTTSATTTFTMPEKDVAIKATYEDETFTVTFNTNGHGTAPASQTVVYGGDIDFDEVTTPSAEGFQFAGWYVLDEYGDKMPFLGYSIYSDTTVYAYWLEVINEVNVTVENPTAGTTVEVTEEEDEDGFIENNQSLQPQITVPSGSHYRVGTPANEERYAYWLTLDEDDDYELFEGTFERGEKYTLEFVLTADDGYVFADDVRVYINGTLATFYDVFNPYHYITSGALYSPYWSPSMLMAIGEVAAKDAAYEILDGDDQTYYYTEGGDLRVRASGDVEKFLYLMVDGEIVDEENYTIESGSTIAVLKSTYLATLPEGDHTLTFVYTDGEVSADFKVAKAREKKTNNPKTGDGIEVFAAMLIVATLGMVVVIKRK